MLEHKFRADPLTAFQVLAYVVRIWERWLATHRGSRSLPPVLPFVLYHGQRPWRAPRRLRELIDLPRPLRTWRGAWPQFSFELADLGAKRSRRRPWHAMPVASRLPLLHLRELCREPDTASLLRQWREDYRRLLALPQGQSIVNRLVSYVAAVSNNDPSRLRNAYQDIDPVTEGKYMTAADKLIRKGRREGRLEGKLEGKLEGRLEGRRTILQTILQERFGELPRGVVAKLEHATLEQLDEWARRLVHATSLARVLG